MAARGDPKVLRFLVIWLRAWSGWSQEQLGEACGSWQSDVSRWEAGEEAPSEEKLRRMAKAIGVPWFVAVALRRIFALALVLVRRFGGPGVPRIPVADVPAPELPAPVALAVAPYLMEERRAGAGSLAVAQARREAAEAVTELRLLPFVRRYPLIEAANVDRTRRDALAAEIIRVAKETERVGGDETAEWWALAGFVTSR